MAIVLSVLQFTISNYPFCIFNLVLLCSLFGNPTSLNCLILQDNHITVHALSLNITFVCTRNEASEGAVVTVIVW